MKTINQYILEKFKISKDIENKKLSYNDAKEIIKKFLFGTGYIIGDNFRITSIDDNDVYLTANEEITFSEDKGLTFNKLKNNPVGFDYISTLHLNCNSENNLQKGFDLPPIKEIKTLSIYDNNKNLKRIKLDNEFEKIDIDKLNITVENLESCEEIILPKNRVNTLSLSIRNYALQDKFDIKNIKGANCKELWLNDICLKERDTNDYIELVMNNKDADSIFISHTDKKWKTTMYQIIYKNDKLTFKTKKMEYV